MALLRPPPGSSTTWAPSPAANDAVALSAVTTWTCAAGTAWATAATVSRAKACARSARRMPGGGCSRLLAQAESLTGTTIRHEGVSVRSSG